MAGEPRRGFLWAETLSPTTMSSSRSTPLWANPQQSRWVLNARSRNRLCSVAVISPRCVHALITGAGVSTPTSRRKPSRAWVEEDFAVTFASTKILVQTQWEAVRFDRVKHTAGTLLQVFSALQRKSAAEKPGAIGLCGTITLRAAAD